MHRLGDVLEALRPEVGHLKLKPRLDLPVGVFRQTNPTRLTDSFQLRSDLHAVSHQVAVALLHDIAQMDADPKFDALVWRDLGVALDHRPLDFNGAVHRVDNATEFDDAAVAGPLDDPAMMHGDGRIDQVAPKGAEPSENSILVRASKPGVADDIGHQDRGQFAGLAHSSGSPALRRPS
jgi:hypothetical protein